MRVRRRPVVDEYHHGDQCAVMVDDRVLVLSPLATALLAELGRDGALDHALVDRLVTRYGPPNPNVSPTETLMSIVYELESYDLVETYLLG